MRKVKFRQYDKEKKNFVEGEGLFHGWAPATIEYESGPGNYTVAIVEIEGGYIIDIEPTRIQFLDTPTESNTHPIFQDIFNSLNLK